MSYRRNVLPSVTHTGRYTTIIVGLLGLFTSVQIACSFSSEPPEGSSGKAKKGSVTDSGPIDPGSSSGTSGSSGTSSGDSYGYGYGPDGCYGYGLGYDTTYAAYNPTCD